MGACGEDWVEVKDAGWQVDRSLVANNPHIAEVGFGSVDWGEVLPCAPRIDTLPVFMWCIILYVYVNYTHSRDSRLRLGELVVLYDVIVQTAAT